MEMPGARVKWDRRQRPLTHCLLSEITEGEKGRPQGISKESIESGDQQRALWLQSTLPKSGWCAASLVPPFLREQPSWLAPALETVLLHQWETFGAWWRDYSAWVRHLHNDDKRDACHGKALWGYRRRLLDLDNQSRWLMLSPWIHRRQ